MLQEFKYEKSEEKEVSIKKFVEDSFLYCLAGNYAMLCYILDRVDHKHNNYLCFANFLGHDLGIKD